MRTVDVYELKEFIDIIHNCNSEPLEIFTTYDKYDETDNKSEGSEDIKHYYAYLKERGERISLSKKDFYNRKNGFFFYRGQYDSEYELLPSVFREGFLNNEDYFYHEMMVRCSDQMIGLNRLDRLVRMQHYNCPTRLLDITTNPLVAVFFACRNYSCENCDTSDKGAVYVFFTNRKSVKYSDSDRIMMLSTIPELSYEDKRLLNRISVDSLKMNAFDQSDKEEYVCGELERYFQTILRERPTFKREIRPIDLIKPIIVQPNHTNSRISKQEGAFILSGLSKDEEDARIKIEQLVAMKIIIHNRVDILKDLDYLGINDASLFLDMESVSEYLRHKVKCIE